MNLQELYGPAPTSDKSDFIRKARFLQSWYRVNVLNEKTYGNGPNENSPTKNGNMLVDGINSGANFLSPEIFNYAHFRVVHKKKGETIEPFRLFSNMLGSQPMCFNLFYPLKALFEQVNPSSATKILDACLPELKIATILSIEIEYFPYPKSEYLNDLTAFDAMILYKSQAGERNILAIETKYTETLGSNSSGDLTAQIQLVNESPYFNKKGKEHGRIGFGQLGRNFLLAEKYRIENRLDKCFAVVIAPDGNSSTDTEIEQFQSWMNPDYQNRLFTLSLNKMIHSIQINGPSATKNWAASFKQRYLDFEQCEEEYKKYRKS